MAEKSYAHRDLLDKLGVKDGMRVLLVGEVPKDLRSRLAERSAVDLVEKADDDPVNLVLFAPGDGSRVKPDLAEHRARITTDGAIWVLTPKRGQPGYVRQEALIPQGKAVGLVDNKICSVDETTSAIRFVIPVAWREHGSGRGE
ncbi:MAG: DUF3052 domain-containing protein [Chloroflexi bacterium]|nr:DUF3052 domain-containing protein [Chloroflexota bacterium]